MWILARWEIWVANDDRIRDVCRRINDQLALDLFQDIDDFSFQMNPVVDDDIRRTDGVQIFFTWLVGMWIDAFIKQCFYLKTLPGNVAYPIRHDACSTQDDGFAWRESGAVFWGCTAGGGNKDGEENWGKTHLI